MSTSRDCSRTRRCPLRCSLAHAARAALAALACAAALAAAATPVAAQVAPNGPPEVRRPYRGLFGQQPVSAVGQTLNFSASVFGAYDDDVFADQGFVDPAVRQGGWYQGGQASLTYARMLRPVSLSAQAAVGLSRHSDPVKYLPNYLASVSLGTRIARRTNVTLSGTFSYAPEFRLGLFVSPDNPAVFADPFGTVSPDLGVFSQQSYRTTIGATASRTLTSRSSLSGSYGLSTATYGGPESNYSSQGGGILYSYRLSRNAGARLGYSYATGAYRSTPGLRRRGIHNIDAGVDYGRALSISRRTSLSFSTGSAIYVTDQAFATGGREKVNYAFLGSANLNHEIGRTWTASLVYSRSLAFHEGFADPFLSHAVSANVGGLLTRRLRSTSSASFGNGAVGVGSANGFDSATFNSGLQYAFTRFLAGYASYVYYRYNFDADVAVDPRLPRSLERQGVRVGLSTSIPLIR